MSTCLSCVCLACLSRVCLSVSCPLVSRLAVSCPPVCLVSTLPVCLVSACLVSACLSRICLACLSCIRFSCLSRVRLAYLVSACLSCVRLSLGIPRFHCVSIFREERSQRGPSWGSTHRAVCDIPGDASEWPGATDVTERQMQPHREEQKPAVRPWPAPPLTRAVQGSGLVFWLRNPVSLARGAEREGLPGQHRLVLQPSRRGYWPTAACSELAEGC